MKETLYIVGHLNFPTNDCEPFFYLFSLAIYSGNRLVRRQYFGSMENVSKIVLFEFFYDLIFIQTFLVTEIPELLEKILAWLFE